MNKKQKKLRNRILVALGIFLVMEILEIAGVFESLPYGQWIEFVAFLIPYLIAGYDVLAKAWHGITHKQPFDENLLMAIATIGAFSLIFFPESEAHMAEGAAVMLFYQVGSLFESYAVGKTRKSISAMMDIAPDYANVMRDGTASSCRSTPMRWRSAMKSLLRQASAYHLTALSSLASRNSILRRLPASRSRASSRKVPRSLAAAST